MSDKFISFTIAEDCNAFFPHACYLPNLQFRLIQSLPDTKVTCVIRMRKSYIMYSSENIMTCQQVVIKQRCHIKKSKLLVMSAPLSLQHAHVGCWTTLLFLTLNICLWWIKKTTLVLLWDGDVLTAKLFIALSVMHNSMFACTLCL